jgi:hypothetical protein
MARRNRQSQSPTGKRPTITPAPVPPPPAPANVNHYLAQLAELWKSHRRAGLKVRHRTGKLLNELFNAPSTRQARGAEVLKKAAKRLCVAVSELSRMRNFAHLFPSLDKFVQKHGTKTWTEVKALLPTLKGEKPRPKSGRKPRKNAKRFNDRCCQRIKTLTERLKQVESNGLTQEQRTVFRVRLEKFAEVARTRLGIAVTVGGAVRERVR